MFPAYKLGEANVDLFISGHRIRHHRISWKSCGASEFYARQILLKIKSLFKISVAAGVLRFSNLHVGQCPVHRPQCLLRICWLMHPSSA